MSELIDNWFLGSSCGHHGPYAFYRILSYINQHDASLNRTLGLGQFFYARIYPDSPICIGELQLLWENERDEGPKLASVKLYYLPEDTPNGRLPRHGQDELLVVDKKIVLEVNDLIKWFVEGPINWRENADKNKLLPSDDKKIVSAETDLNNGRKNRLTLVTDSMCILSFSQYCRYRAVKKRLEGTGLNPCLLNKLSIASVKQEFNGNWSSNLADDCKSLAQNDKQSVLPPSVALSVSSRVETKESIDSKPAHNGKECCVVNSENGHEEAIDLVNGVASQIKANGNSCDVISCNASDSDCDHSSVGNKNHSIESFNTTSQPSILQNKDENIVEDFLGSEAQSLKRKRESQESALERFICAIGGGPLYENNVRVVFCKDMFSHPQVNSHEFRRDGLAPKLKGRRRRMRVRNEPMTPDNKRHLSAVRRSATAAAKSAIQKRSKLDRVLGDPVLFHKGYNKFMIDRKTPVKKPPSLGFKEVDMFEFFTLVHNLGGYKKATQDRVWKVIYDKLGGHPNNTSAATCTRRIYEKLLLGYERYLRDEDKKFSAKFKDHQFQDVNPGLQASKKNKNENQASISAWNTISESSSSVDSYSVSSSGKQHKSKVLDSGAGKGDGAYRCRIVISISQGNVSQSIDETSCSSPIDGSKSQQGVMTRQKRKIIDRSIRDAKDQDFSEIIKPKPDATPTDETVVKLDTEDVMEQHSVSDIKVNIAKSSPCSTPVESFKCFSAVEKVEQNNLPDVNRKRPHSTDINSSDELASKNIKLIHDTKPSVVSSASEEVMRQNITTSVPTVITSSAIAVPNNISNSTTGFSSINQSNIRLGAGLGNLTLSPGCLSSIRFPPGSLNSVNFPIPVGLQNNNALLEAASAAVRADSTADGSVSPAAVAALLSKMVALDAASRAAGIPIGFPGMSFPVAGSSASLSGNTKNTREPRKDLSQSVIGLVPDASSKIPISQASGVLGNINSPIKQFLDRTRSLASAPDMQPNTAATGRAAAAADDDMPTDLSMKTMKRLEEESRNKSVIDITHPQDEPLNLSLKPRSSGRNDLKPVSLVKNTKEAPKINVPFSVFVPSPSVGEAASRIPQAHSSSNRHVSMTSLQPSLPTPARHSLSSPATATSLSTSYRAPIDPLLALRQKSAAEAMATLSALRLNLPTSMLTSGSLGFTQPTCSAAPFTVVQSSGGLTTLSLAALTQPGMPLAALCQMPVVVSRPSSTSRRRESSSHSGVMSSQSCLAVSLASNSNIAVSKAIQSPLSIPSVSLLQAAAAAAAANYRPPFQLFPSISSSSALLSALPAALASSSGTQLTPAAASLAASVAAAAANSSGGSRLALSVPGGTQSAPTLFLPTFPPYFMPRFVPTTAVPAENGFKPK